VKLLSLLLLAATFAPTAIADAPAREAAPVVEKLPVRYQVMASSARLNRRAMGPITNRVQGVPAEPIDSLVYDGKGHRRIPGQAILEVDPGRQRGVLRAWWEDDEGRWELKQDVFHHPHHASGLRMGSSREKIDEEINLAIVQNVHLHGDTGAGTAVQPTVFAYLATWGLYEITLNGEPFLNPFGWPGPDLWLGHGVVTAGVRDEDDGSIRTVDGEIYDPTKHAARGATDPNDLELHLAFHDERFPKTANRPALFAFEYHLIFEDVVMRITDSQTPLDFDDFEGSATTTPARTKSADP
jgi:hypothetical protein